MRDVRSSEDHPKISKEQRKPGPESQRLAQWRRITFVVSFLVPYEGMTYTRFMIPQTTVMVDNVDCSPRDRSHNHPGAEYIVVLYIWSSY